MVLPNPWANLREEASRIRTPILILNAQAEMLEEASSGLIKGSIDVREDRSLGRTTATFAVLVPRLNNYMVRLFSVSQSMTQYPATLKPHWGESVDSIKCENEIELEAAVDRYCRRAEVQKIVTGLLAQAGQAMGS